MLMKKSASLLVIVVMLVSGLAVIVAPTVAEVSRTGDTGNEPVGGFYEWNDTFRIHHLDGTNDTDFLMGDTCYVNITTERVSDMLGGNLLRVLDYQDTVVLEQEPAFTQTDGSAPDYSYEASFLINGATFNADHYRLEVELEDDDGFIFKTADTIIVAGGGNPFRSIETYSDDNFTIPEHSFGRYDVVYIKLWKGPQQVRAQNSEIIFANYQDRTHNRGLHQLVNNTLATNGSYIYIAYDLDEDLNHNAIGLEGAWWYSIEISLATPGGNDIILNWATQVYIKDWPDLAELGAFPPTVNRPGNDVTTIFGNFQDLDSSGPNDFRITIRIREPDDATVITLVDNGTNGNNGLIVTEMANKTYNATFDWDPADSVVLGLYDLYMKVNDSTNQSSTAIFDDNLDELEVTDDTINVPVLVAGNTRADPDVVPRPGTATTVILSNFTDPDDHAEEEFLVSFKVRDESDVEIVLVDMAAQGDGGEFGGEVEIVKTAPQNYTVAYEWDPPDSVDLGMYDLYFNVTDPTMNLAEDIFVNNEDELEITDGSDPVEILDLLADPPVVNKMGADVTKLMVNFTDPDTHPIADYLVSFSVKDPEGTVIDIALAQGNGDIGEFGETLIIEERVEGGLMATMDWDPAETAVVGLYDLSVNITDPANISEIYGFDDNPDELNVTTSEEPPMIESGDLVAVPDTVPRVTNAVTTMTAKFTDPDTVDPEVFIVTFKVRDIGNQEYLLVDGKANGGDGEFGGTVTVMRTGNHFTATYRWDPPVDQPLGLYDLYFSVNDGYVTVKDPFNENQDELEIVDQPAPLQLEMGGTYALPDEINRNGTTITTIMANFTDIDETDAMNFTVTFRLRSPSQNIIMLADAKKHGQVGEGGGQVTVENVTDGWVASVTWDPPADAELGTYDLFCKIADQSNEVEDGFDMNLEELTVVERPVAVVKDVRVHPTSIFAENDNITTILIDFSDPLERPIANFSMTIKVRDEEGNVTLLVDDKTSGGTGVYGGQLVVNKAGQDYTASYEWDPSPDVLIGMYDLHALVRTSIDWEGTSGFGDNEDELEIKSLPVVGDPSLESPDVSKENGEHRFGVVYKNSENLPPDEEGVVLVLGAQRYKMIAVDVTDDNYAGGKSYYFLIELGEGKQNYHFEVTDTSGETASTNEKTVKVGGEDDVQDDSSALIAALIALLVIIIVLLIGALFYLQNKRQEEKRMMKAGTEVEKGVPVAKTVDEEPEVGEKDEVDKEEGKEKEDGEEGKEKEAEEGDGESKGEGEGKTEKAVEEKD